MFRALPPLDGIRQREQVQTGEKLQGEREHHQEAPAWSYTPLYYGAPLTMTVPMGPTDVTFAIIAMLNNPCGNLIQLTQLASYSRGGDGAASTVDSTKPASRNTRR